MSSIGNTIKLTIGASIVLCSVLLPFSAYAATSSTGGTTVNATVASTISLSTNTAVSIGLTPTSGGVVSSGSDTVSVSTNNVNGYTLTLSDTDSNTSLVSGGNSIAAHVGSQAAPTALAANTWGYRVVGVGGFGAAAYTSETNNSSSNSIWAGVPVLNSANTIKTTNVTAASDVTTVYYGVKATTSKPSGTYVDTVTYTAITN